MLPLAIHIERRREKVLKELWGQLKPTKGHTDTIYKLEFGPRLIKQYANTSFGYSYRTT